MRARSIAALAVIAVLGLAVPTAGADSTRATATITVWLQPEAKSGWQAAINDATKAVQAKNPGTEINVEEQQVDGAPGEARDVPRGWKSPGRRRDGKQRDAALHGGRGVRAAEEGGLSQLEDLAEGLDRLGSFAGKLYGVPYYAGARAVIYRTDLYRAAGARCPRLSTSSTPSAASS